MKAKTLPDWFAPLFGWLITALVWGAAYANQPGIYVNRHLLWYPPLLAIAWTSGYVAMRRLRTKFGGEFERLGRPQLFGSPLDSATWNFLPYVVRFRFVRLADPIITGGFGIFVTFTALAMVLFLKAASHHA
jgi:hypothetical protein